MKLQKLTEHLNYLSNHTEINHFEINIFLIFVFITVNIPHLAVYSIKRIWRNADNAKSSKLLALNVMQICIYENSRI